MPKHSLPVACCTVNVAEKERENKSRKATRDVVCERGLDTIKKNKQTNIKASFSVECLSASVYPNSKLYKLTGQAAE